MEKKDKPEQHAADRVPSVEDMRKHPRLGPLVIRTVFETHRSQGKGYVTNLSLGGAFLATEQPLLMGEAIDLLIDLPWNMGKVTASAKVVWLTSEADRLERQVPAGGGLAFDHLQPLTAEKLHSYMRKFAELAARIDED